MKNFLIGLSLLVTMMVPVMITGSALAVDLVPACSDAKLQATSVCPEIQKNSTATQSPIVHVIDIIINILAYVIGVAAVFGIILSGLRLMLANGDSGAINKARQSLLYSLVGLAVAALAESIVIFVLDKL